jgi:NAD-dependent DNA ligase
MNKIEQLLNNIKRYNKLYREGNPEISDREYDSLVSQLKELEPDNEWLKHPEPVEISAKRKVPLPIQMKSLNKAKSMADVERWIKSLGLPDITQMIYMPKFDGLSLLRDEIKKKAYSRGGIENEGQDCSAHFEKAGFVSGIYGAHFTYGEVVFSNKNWDLYFKGKNSIHSGEPFKSPRNTAAGLLNREEPSSYLSHASFYRYGIDPSSLRNFVTYEEVLNFLSSSYKQTALYKQTLVKHLNEDDLINAFSEWSEIYPIDGIVIYINDLRLWEYLGRNQTSGNPLYAIAYKHPDFSESFQTTVKGVSWKVSKSGALKPVVQIEPVDTGDCNMENPTGYNASWIDEMDIAKGAKILVTRSGGVIPKILSTIQPASEEEIQSHWDGLAECPSCGAPTAWNESYVELCCTNPECPGRKLAKIIFFFTTCGAENVGEETYSKMFGAGFTSIKSILDVTFDELMQIDGFGEATSNIILDNNRKIKAGVDMATLMHASDCFEGIGKIKAQKILDEMLKDGETLYHFYQGWYVPETDEDYIAGQTKTKQSFLRGVRPFYQFIAENDLDILPPSKKEVKTDGKCKDMAVCFSGVRDAELEELILQEGGKVVSGISKNTTVLVVKDKNASSGKINKANDLGIKLLEIGEFKELFGSNS